MMMPSLARLYQGPSLHLSRASHHRQLRPEDGSFLSSQSHNISLTKLRTEIKPSFYILLASLRRAATNLGRVWLMMVSVDSVGKYIVCITSSSWHSRWFSMARGTTFYRRACHFMRSIFRRFRLVGFMRKVISLACRSAKFSWLPFIPHLAQFERWHTSIRDARQILHLFSLSHATLPLLPTITTAPKSQKSRAWLIRCSFRMSLIVGDWFSFEASWYTSIFHRVKMLLLVKSPRIYIELPVIQRQWRYAGFSWSFWYLSFILVIAPILNFIIYFRFKYYEPFDRD